MNHSWKADSNQTAHLYLFLSTSLSPLPSLSLRVILEVLAEEALEEKSLSLTFDPTDCRWLEHTQGVGLSSDCVCVSRQTPSVYAKLPSPLSLSIPKHPLYVFSSVAPRTAAPHRPPSYSDWLNRGPQTGLCDRVEGGLRCLGLNPGIVWEACFLAPSSNTPPPHTHT